MAAWRSIPQVTSHHAVTCVIDMSLRLQWIIYFQGLDSSGFSTDVRISCLTQITSQQWKQSSHSTSRRSNSIVHLPTVTHLSTAGRKGISQRNIFRKWKDSYCVFRKATCYLTTYSGYFNYAYMGNIIFIFLITASVLLNSVTKVMVCAILSVGWCI